MQVYNLRQMATYVQASWAASLDLVLGIQEQVTQIYRQTIYLTGLHLYIKFGSTQCHIQDHCYCFTKFGITSIFSTFESESSVGT